MTGSRQSQRLSCLPRSAPPTILAGGAPPAVAVALQSSSDPFSRHSLIRVTVITPETRIRLPSQVVLQELNDEGLLVDLRRGMYHGLNATALEMLNCLASGTLTVEQVISRLFEQYSVDESVLRRDVVQLIEKLVADGLVEIDSA